MAVYVGYDDIIDLGAQRERFEWFNIRKVLKNDVVYSDKLVQSRQFCERRRETVFINLRIEFEFGIGRMVGGVGIWVGGD